MQIETTGFVEKLLSAFDDDDEEALQKIGITRTLRWSN